MADLLWLIPALPLAGFLALVLTGRRLTGRGPALVGCLSVGLAMAASFAAAAAFLASAPPGHAITKMLYTWFNAGGLAPSFGFYLDGLSLLMVVVITVVAFLIHIYSADFMAADSSLPVAEDGEGYSRFFAYMNLFVGSMLVLVLADNLLLLYLGWEGVGLCSYLLIGFWYKDPANGRAAVKAFVVTRVGDASLAVGLFIIACGARHLRHSGGHCEGRAFLAGRVGRGYRGCRPAPRRGGRKIGPAPAPDLAPRRDGRPLARERPHPRGDDGDGRGLPDRQDARALHPRPGRAYRRRRHRRGYAPHSRGERPRPEGHQARPRLFDDEPGRLHVPRPGRRRVVGRHLPLHDPRLLQSPPLPVPRASS